jgi:hypothetical protein
LNKIKLVGIAHSKLRNAIGLVGITVDPVRQECSVNLAKHWDRNNLNDIGPEISDLFQKFEWSNTIIDLAVGEHIIQALRRGGLPIKVIFIKKKVTDVSEIRRVKSLDLVEMVQFMLQMKQIHKIKFPKNPSPVMKELEDQIALYSEQTTEAGGINYYAPGDEMDDLTKALISAVFAARPMIQESIEIIAGPLRTKEPDIEDLSRLGEPTFRRRKIRGK